MGTTKKTRKRAAKPKPKAEEPQEGSARVNPAKERLGEIIKEAAAKEGVPLPFKPAPVVVPDDGTLLRMDGAPSVFVMRDGQRRPFANAAAFTACGFGWNEIVVLPPKEIIPIPVGPEVTRKSDL